MGRGQKVTTGRGAKNAAMESHKRKLRGRGHAHAEPADVRIGREITGKVGNSKKVMIGQTRQFVQVWTKMVVLVVFLMYFPCCWFLALPFACLVHS